MNRHQEESAVLGGQFRSCPAGPLCRKEKARLCFSTRCVWVIMQVTLPTLTLWAEHKLTCPDSFSVTCWLLLQPKESLQGN